MSHPPDDESHLDPVAARLVSRVRRLMAISGVTTLLAITAVVGVIGYRVFRAEGSGALVDLTAALPKDARVVSVTAADDRLVVMLDIAGALEVRTFDLKTLKPAGRLRFAPAP